MGLGDFPKAVVGIVVAVLIVVSLAIPVIADYGDGEPTTRTNTGGTYMTVIDGVADGTKTIVLDGDAKSITVNGTATPKVENNTLYFYTENSYVFGYNKNSDTSWVWTVYYMSSGTMTTVANVTDVSITVTPSTTNNSISLVYTLGGSDTTLSYTASTVGFIDKTGTFLSYRNSSATAVSYFIDDTAKLDTVGLYSTQLGVSVGSDLYINGTKSTTDTVTATTHAITDVNTIKTMDVCSTVADSDVYLTLSDTDTAVNYIVLPAVANGAVPPDATLNTVISIIPVLMVIGIVIAAAALIKMKS